MFRANGPTVTRGAFAAIAVPKRVTPSKRLRGVGWDCFGAALDPSKAEILIEDAKDFPNIKYAVFDDFKNKDEGFGGPRYKMIMWPGTYSLAAKKLPYASVSMFAFLAFAGDLGCLIGPSCAGWISALFGNDLRIAFLFSALFPILMLLLIKFTNNKNKTLKGKKQHGTQ